MDSNHSENTKRIAKNTLFLYGRMLFGMLVSLYTSRLILQALGVEDYGIYNVVGGFVAMFSLISNSLTSSIWRFMTFETGTGNMAALKKVFGTSLLIQIVMSVIIVLLCETIGVWFLNTKMTIPDVRLVAANWVFQASVVGFVIGLLICPYSAVLISHEKMDIYAQLGVLDILLKLGTVLFVAYAPFEFDRLIAYAFILVGNSLLMQAIYIIYCLRHYPESRTLPVLDKFTWKEMSGFAGWNAIGNSAVILKDQGVNVLLNIFFGPVVNAARGVASTVSSAVGSFAGNLMNAVNPQITKSYASKDMGYSYSLVERGSRFGFYIMLFFALPIFLETDYVLKLWLGEYPDFTVIFTRLVLILSLVDILSSTLITLQQATGKIRNYQLAVGGMLLMNFPLSYIVLKIGLPSWGVYGVAIVIAVACLWLRLFFIKQMLEFDIKRFLYKVCWNVCVVTITATILPVIAYILLPQGLLRFLVIIGLTMVSISSVILYIGCDKDERDFILSRLGFIKRRLLGCI